MTIREPFAWLVAAGIKPVENRWFRPSEFGVSLAIHAGVSVDEEAMTASPIADVIREWSESAPHPGPAGPPWRTLGAVLAVAELTSICVSPRSGCDCGPWAIPGLYHWRLTNVRPLTRPVPCRGRQGLWTLPEGVCAEVEEQIQ